MANPFIPEIGRSVPRADALAKVTGVEKYTVDHYGENLLWAGVRRAGVPHGFIRKLDTTSAQPLPGVVAVLTGGDVPGGDILLSAEISEGSVEEAFAACAVVIEETFTVPS